MINLLKIINIFSPVNIIKMFNLLNKMNIFSIVNRIQMFNLLNIMNIYIIQLYHYTLFYTAANVHCIQLTKLL